jgi:ferredoxin-NADP reductase
VQRLAGTGRLRDFRYCPVLSEPPADWTGARGELDRGNLGRALPQADRAGWVYFICGPTAMIDSVERTLHEMKVPLARIVSEKFQYDFGRKTPRNRRTVAVWLAISAVLVAAAALFALR